MYFVFYQQYSLIDAECMYLLSNYLVMVCSSESMLYSKELYQFFIQSIFELCPLICGEYLWQPDSHEYLQQNLPESHDYKEEFYCRRRTLYMHYYNFCVHLATLWYVCYTYTQLRLRKFVTKSVSHEQIDHTTII